MAISDAEFKEQIATKLSTITIMIIITRTMMTTLRMIRSFSFLAAISSWGCTRQLVGARTSIQLILYLPNYTILFLISCPFDHPNEKRNPTWWILFHAAG